jgi:uncharacterized damage-inducible protein DinB
VSIHIAAWGQSPLVNEFLQKWNNSKAYTIALLEAYPADKLDYKPSDSVMSFREQVVHMILGIVWHSGTYLQEKQFSSTFERNKIYDKNELIKIMTEAYDFSSEIVRTLTPEDLEERVDFFAGNFTKRQILNLMDDHVTHHRGELIVYLRLNNVKPPDYRGW